MILYLFTDITMVLTDTGILDLSVGINNDNFWNFENLIGIQGLGTGNEVDILTPQINIL